MIAWRETKAEAPPQDSATFWAWLAHAGIQLMRWKSAAEVAIEFGCAMDECEGRYVTIGLDEECIPDFWLPLTDLPWPPGISVWHFLNATPPRLGSAAQGKRARR